MTPSCEGEQSSAVLTGGQERSGNGRGPAFPVVSTELTRADPPADEARAFIAAVLRWRKSAIAWLDVHTARREMSTGLRDLLKWVLGSPDMTARTTSGYHLRPFPEPAGSAPEHVLDVLVWRSGVVDYLSDVWDTIGPGDYELDECTLAIDALFTPPSLRGVPTCPDCLQPLPETPKAAGAHAIACPVRLRREHAAGRSPPDEWL